MKVAECPSAEVVLKFYVPDNILKLKPVIAGGFIVSLYESIIKNKSQEYQERLSSALKKNSSINQFQLREAIVGSKTSPGTPLQFGDIDLWFLSENEIWNDSHPFNFLVSKLEPDPPTLQQKIFITGGMSHIQLPNHSIPSYNHPKTYYGISKNLESSIKYLGLNAGYGIKSSTTWANTFLSCNKDSFESSIQMVRRPQNSIEDLFSSFDIANCCAAYYDGKFYFSDLFEEASQSKTLEKGEKFNKDIIQNKIWTANRAFKYAKRYGLDFSNSICEDMVNLFVDTEEFMKKIYSSELDDLILKTDTLEIEDAYGQTTMHISKETLLSLSKNLLHNFRSLILMKNFNTEYIFLFLNSKEPSIIDEVKKYVEIQERISRGEGESKEVSWKEKYEGLF